MTPTSSWSESSILRDAREVTFNNSTIHQHYPKDVRVKLPTAFSNRVLLNACENRDRRGKLSRCLDETRVRVITDIKNWIDDIEGPSQGCQSLWLTGPAGSGKSAIVQSVSDFLKARRHPAANFFYQHIGSEEANGSMMMTFAYQLAFNPGHLDMGHNARQFIATAITENTLLLNESVENQFKCVIQDLIRHISPSRRVVLLIDGLDACEAPMLREQSGLLALFEDFDLNITALPIKFLFASRKEPRLISAFNKLGDSVHRLSLEDNRYAAEAHKDIEQFVWHELMGVKKNHTNKFVLDWELPPPSIVNKVVSDSSGQFLYAAAAMAHVWRDAESPAQSLQDLTHPHGPSAALIAPVDMIYKGILSNHRDYGRFAKIVEGELLLRAIPDQLYDLRDCLDPIGIDVDNIAVDVCRLLAIVEYNVDRRRLTFHHASLGDFLVDKQRAGTYHVDMKSFACDLTEQVFRKKLLWQEPNRFRFICHVLGTIARPSPSLAEALSICSEGNPYDPSFFVMEARDIDERPLLFQFFIRAKALYPDDEERYMRIIHNWLQWSVPLLGVDFDSMALNLVLYEIDHGPEIWANVLHEVDGANTPSVVRRFRLSSLGLLVLFLWWWFHRGDGPIEDLWKWMRHGDFVVLMV